jgi:hypothetical protein
LTNGFSFESAAAVSQASSSAGVEEIRAFAAAKGIPIVCFGRRESK